MTMDWRHRAECRDEDPELFFPVGTTGPALLQITEAKAVCYRCPVRAECLEWALSTGQNDGIWGGLSEDERRSAGQVLARAGERLVVDDPTPLRLCQRCNHKYTVDHFNRDRKRADKLSAVCKDCTQAHDRERREAKALSRVS